MTSIPKDIVLYNKIKKLADKKFLAKTSVYKSSWIVQEYKRLGGTYIGNKPKSSGLKRWYREEWVDLNRPLYDDTYEKCGRTTSSENNTKYPLCRPTLKITKDTPKTWKELSPKSIKAAKIKKSKLREKGRITFQKGGLAQFFGKRSDIMISIPKDVKKWAKKAFDLKKIGFKGATSTGWRRAHQLATKESIPIEDLRYMRNWYARHVISSYPTFLQWKSAGYPKTAEWFDRRGIISWVTWGAEPGLKWVNSQKVINILNEVFDKDYRKILVRD